MEAEEIFAAAAAGDARLGEVVDTYLRRLGVGIVNIVNIFRPQAVIIGGDVPFQEEIVPPLGSEAGVIGASGLL